MQEELRNEHLYEQVDLPVEEDNDCDSTISSDELVGRSRPSGSRSHIPPSLDLDRILQSKKSNIYVDTPTKGHPPPLFTSSVPGRQRKLNCVGVSMMLGLLILSIGCSGLIQFLSNTERTDVSIDALETMKSRVTINGIRQTLRYFTEKGRIAGSANDYEMAKYIQEEAIASGISKKLKLVYPKEKEYPKEQLVDEKKKFAFHLFSPSGKASGQIVYCNYGRVEDFQHLKQNQIQVQGRIALIRRGKIAVNVKVKNAADFAAIGVITYSDISSNLYAETDNVYLGYGEIQSRSGRSTEEELFSTVRTRWNESIPQLSKIPSMPVGNMIAKELLSQMKGRQIPANMTEWVGNLGNLTYHYDDKDAKVEMETKNYYTPQKIHNVIITLPGARSDRYIILGHQRDSATAKVGATASGTAVFVEVLRGIGRLVSGGYFPARTLILASWGAEEYGSIGRSIWIQQNYQQVVLGATIYMDIGSPATFYDGALHCQATPSLLNTITKAAQLINSSLVSDWVPAANRNTTDLQSQVRSPGKSEDGLYSPFVGLLGVPTISLSFYSSKVDPTDLPSDTFESISTKDGEFRGHQTLAQLWGSLILQFMKPILPIQYQVPAIRLASEFHRINGTISTLQSTNLTRLLSAVETFANATQAARATASKLSLQLREQFDEEPDANLISKLQRFNDQLLYTEKTFANSQSNKGLPWWRNELYGPLPSRDYEIGYFPQLQEAIYAKDQATLLHSLNKLCQALEQAAAILSGKLLH